MSHAEPRPEAEHRPEPVLTAAQCSAAATWTAGLAVAWLGHRGWLLPEQIAAWLARLIELGIVAAVGLGTQLWASYWARARVTPGDDPRDADGNRLVPARDADTYPEDDDWPADTDPAGEPTADVPAVELPDAYPATVEIPRGAHRGRS